MSAPTLHTVHGQPSWSFRSSHVHAHLTRLGGQLGPVAFRLEHRLVTPFSVAPWAEEDVPAETPAMLRALRGDFFCAPFGGNAASWRGEQHPPHGETANATWKLKAFEREGDRVTLHATLATSIRPGRVDKFITLQEGHAAVYQRHVVAVRGPLNVGHHAMIKFPDAPGSGHVTTSRFVHGQVFPDAFESPENAGYQSLKPGAVFRSLDRVPLLNGGTADLGVYPARRGFEDLVMLTADDKLPFAWNAVTFPGQHYAWFALRNPRQLRHTVFWISNGGRHYAPWNGRHTGVMGIEDVTSYFHYGIAESVGRNALNKKGIPTAFTFNPAKPTSFTTIMGVAAIPNGFDRVREIRPAKDGVDLIAANGKRARCALDLDFLSGP